MAPRIPIWSASQDWPGSVPCLTLIRISHTGLDPPAACERCFEGSSRPASHRGEPDAKGRAEPLGTHGRESSSTLRYLMI